MKAWVRTEYREEVGVIHIGFLLVIPGVIPGILDIGGLDIGGQSPILSFPRLISLRRLGLARPFRPLQVPGPSCPLRHQNQFVALQSRMLINESNDSMAELCEADKAKVKENAAKGRVEAWERGSVAGDAERKNT